MKLEVLESFMPTRSNEIRGSRELHDNRIPRVNQTEDESHLIQVSNLLHKIPYKEMNLLAHIVPTFVPSLIGEMMTSTKHYV